MAKADSLVAHAWQRQLESTLKLVPGYDPWSQAGDSWLDHEAARTAIDFFPECLKHVEGSMAGQPFTLEPWQQAIIGNLFGWKRKDSKGRVVRRYRELFLYVPRKNGKTPLCAGICLFVLFCDNEPGAQVVSAAGEREQAALLFRHAKGMVEQEPELDSRATIYGGRGGTGGFRSIVLKEDPASVYKVISADGDTKHGGNLHLALIDELHVQPNRDLVDALTTSMASANRAQPLTVYITTADYDRPSICNEKYKQATDVRDNGGDTEKPGYDPAFLPVIFEAGADDDWRKPETWKKANPNYGVSVSEEYMAREAKKAIETPAYQNVFRRLHLNQRTSQDMQLIPMERWDACPNDMSTDDLRGKTCYAGVDLASTEDLASLCLVFPMENERWAVLSYSWCPISKIDKRKAQRIPYDVWERQGHLYATGGDQISYASIRAKIDELAAIYNIRELGYDPHGATQFAQDLQQDFGEDFVVFVTQSFRNLAGPTKEIIRRLKLGKIVHFQNPVLRWAASNVAAHIDGKIPAGEKIDDYLDKVPIMASKRKSTEKIDPFAALVIAVARMTSHPEAESGSVYETAGSLML